jgi:hypothetical protein
MALMEPELQDLLEVSGKLPEGVWKLKFFGLEAAQNLAGSFSQLWPQAQNKLIGAVLISSPLQILLVLTGVCDL